LNPDVNSIEKRDTSSLTTIVARESVDEKEEGVTLNWT
jgi:hypothetical protein